MKRWLIMTVMIMTAAAITMACSYLPGPSSQAGISGAADLGLLLLDTAEGVSVLGVQDKSFAEQADIRPGDLLLRVNGQPLGTADTLDSLLKKGIEELILIDFQRGKNVLSVKIPITSIVH